MVKRTRVGLAGAMIGALACGVAWAGTWAEVGDAGELLTTGQVTSGTGLLTAISGIDASLQADVDLYKINIIDKAAFFASTNPADGGAHQIGFDTKLWLFDATTGYGVDQCDDGGASGAGASKLTSPYVPANGLYWLAISHYMPEASRADGGWLWSSSPYSERGLPNNFPTSPLAQWTNKVGTGGSYTYTIALGGASYAVPEPASLVLLSLAVIALRRR